MDVVGFLSQIEPPLPPPWLDPAVFLSNLFWVFLRTFTTFVVVFILGLVSLRVVDWITPGVKELERVKGHPLATALFAAGFFVYLSFGYIASMASPIPVGLETGIVSGPNLSPLVLIGYKLVTLLFGVLLSYVFAIVYYRILARVEPFGLDLDDVDKEPLAVGVYLFGYLVFLGAVVYVALMLPAA
ncbi:MAG: hypothetical protein NYU39_03585 [Aigarchaeota archaeon]|nr:hypothetical protein [Candidatus Caldarchaeales archaeon]MDJ0272678.1 hypothetical protein [Candidatus Caldarchaeales archaeon]